MSYYYPGTNCIDHTHRLGFAKMPEGYVLLQLDSGHFMWHHPESDDDSCITWDKWACYHGAKEDLKHRKMREAFEQTKKREHSEHAAILRANP